MNCPICGRDDTIRIETARSLFNRCRNCSFAFLDPARRPSGEEAIARYALHRNSSDDPAYVSFLSAIFDRAIDIAGPGVRRVVDWGSGPVAVGARLLAERGFEVDSWDPHFNAARLPEKAVYDLAICIEVAEHFFDPVMDFSALADRLRPGGVLALHTHFVPENDGEFKSWWYKEDLTHVSFYSIESLIRLARLTGLSPIAFESGRLAFFRRPLPVLVAGGVNWDIEGSPFAPLIPGDSNPGTVRFFAGGTARNIAEDLVHLRARTELLAAVGDDDLGRRMIASCREAGIGTEGIAVVQGHSSSTYVSILDDSGEIALALSGMGVYEAFDPEKTLVAAELALFSARAASFVPRGSSDTLPFSALVVDGNLQPNSIEVLLDRFPSIPAWFDPVSASKARRFGNYRDGVLLSRFTGMKPNLLEAQAMFGCDFSGSDVFNQARAAAEALRARGVAAIYISLGADGVLWLDEAGSGSYSPPKARVVSSTGAGDAFLASLVRSAISGFSGQGEIVRAAAAAAIALGSEEAAPKYLSGAVLERFADAARA
ncbi:MAG: PfkB family carbohydrate kinase [Treponemataceae bacterium]